MLPPQTSDEAWELCIRMEDYYAEAFNGFEEDDIFYEGLLDEFFNVPAGAHVTIPTTARAVVDEAVDNATPKNLLVSYSPRKNTKSAEADADTVRMFIKAMWLYWRSRGGDIDVLRDFLKNLFKSGKAVFKVAPDWSLWPQLTDDTKAEIRASAKNEKEAEEVMAERADLIKKVRAENFPYFCRSIAPACIMEDPSVSTRKLWIIERYEASVEEIRATYALDVEELREYWAVSYPVHEVWTATHIDWRGRLVPGKHWVFVNWELVRESDNPSYELPYVVKYSGLGREAYEGKPEYKSVGFYTRQNKSMFLAEMRRFTHFDAIMSQLAYPIAFLDLQAEMHSIDFTPGAVNYVPERVMAQVDKMWVQPKIPDAEYLASLGAIGSQIERGTVQRAIRGAGVPGTDSAAQLGMITQQATLRIDSAIQATEQAVTEVSAKVLWNIEHQLKDEVGIRAAGQSGQIKIGPKNIQGHYAVSLTFAPNDEQTKERKLVLANDAITKGGLSRYDAYVFAGFENPTELIARSLADKLMQEPLIMRFFAKQALKEWGEDADALEMEARVEEAKKQAHLSEVMNMLQLGALTEVGDPNTPDGSPPGGGAPMPSVPPDGPPAQGLPMQPGSPAAAISGPAAGVVQDINALQAGV